METEISVSPTAVERRIADQLARLRAAAGWSLETLATRTGISRASLSRIERTELSPTAAMLGKLCSVYGWTLSRLMSEAESNPVSLIRAGTQTEWTDPESGYSRRVVSPPATGLRGELVEVRLPVGASVRFEVSPVPMAEHHLWMLEGALSLQLGELTFQLSAGDCLRYLLDGDSHFQCSGRRVARYLIALVHP